MFECIDFNDFYDDNEWVKTVRVFKMLKGPLAETVRFNVRHTPAGYDFRLSNRYTGAYMLNTENQAMLAFMAWFATDYKS